jgi:hypothetical protein
MVNKTQFYKTKVALAVVLSLGLAACGDSDGDANTSTSESVVEDNGGNSSGQVQGTGSVQGTVLDTNGLPVMGATVSLAGSTVTTDASGYYHFTSVPLKGVDGSNDSDANGLAYTVTITGPEGYANAQVSVTTNNIQVDSGNNGTNNETTTDNGEQITWFDGFLAQAETANLPMFSSTVTGVLRNCDTGAALPAGVKVALDFTGIDATGTNTGSNVNIGVPTFTTTTDESGLFSFDALPTDSDFTLAVEGYAADTAGSLPDSAAEAVVANITTTSEGIINNIGDLNVCMITSSDAIAPYIASVDSTINTNTGEGYSWAVLSQGIDGTEGIVLRFNEALDQSVINTAAVVVTSQVDFSDLNAGEKIETVESAVVSEDGLSMTITLATALPEKTKFSVWMPRHEYQDTSANRLVTGDSAGTEYDSIASDDLVFDIVGTSTAAIPGVAAVAAVDAVAAAPSTADLALNVASGITITTVATGVDSDGFTLTLVDGGVAPTVVSFDASGIVVTADATAVDLDGIVAAITGDATAASLATVSVYGDGTSLFVAGAATTAGGVDEVEAVEAVEAVTAVAAVTAGATGSSDKGISSDTINDTQFKTEYVRTRLCTYIAPITSPGSIEGEQLVKQVVAADDSIDAVGVFWDNGGSDTISNLNGQHDQTQDLLQELWNRKNTTSTQTIIDDTAVITGDLNDATSIISDTGSVSTSGSTWSVSVPGAEHGDEVVVTPTAAFNIIGTPITVTLEDKVAPTTVIQDSYNYADTFGDDYVNSVAADSGFANGGELSQIGTSGSEGSPILYVTPRLFASDDNNDDDAEFNNRPDVFLSLAEGNTTDTNGDAYVESTRNFVYDVNAIANWSAISATVGVAFSENINLVTGESVDFSVANTTASTTLADFTANNSQRNEDYVANDTDQDGYHTYLTRGLIQMTSDDIVGLANLDHDGVLDYTGAVSDTVNGNVALSDALVVIADAIPPLVTKAELDATTLVVTFNEPVSSTSGSIKFNDPDAITAEYSLSMTAASSNADNTVFTWTVADGLPSRALFSNTVGGTFSGELDNPNNAAPVGFGGGADLEVVTGTFAFPETTGGADLNHALMTWADVNDARGNNWAEYRALYTDAGTMVGSTANDGIIDSQQDADASTNEWRLALQDVPVYLATDTIAAFDVAVRLAVTFDEVNPLGAIDTAFTVTISSSHPLDLDAANVWGGENVAAFTSAEVLANFAVVDVAGGAATGPAEACLTAGTTRTDTNDSGFDDAGDFCTVDMTTASVSATWNADNTELTLAFTQDAPVITPAAQFEFRKITDAVEVTSTSWAGDRLGHVKSTILDSNGNEQSQDIVRTF